MATPLIKYLPWQEDLGDDEDITASQYLGFINEDSAWYITKRNGNDITFTAGSSDAESNWTSRASLTYDTFNNITFS